MEQEAADAGKVAMDTDLAVVEYLQRNNKKLAVFARLHAFGDLDVFNIVVQTLEDGERPQFEVMAGIGCAVVDVVEVVDVVGVVDERAGNQLPKLKPAAAARNGEQILGKPPACIERQAVAADFFAAQQGFKTCQRSHGMYFVCVLETGQDICLFGGFGRHIVQHLQGKYGRCGYR